MADCIFCQIVAGKIPAYKIYENEKVICILDINPANKGHVLVLPKNHVKTIFEMDPKDYAIMMDIGRAVAGTLFSFGAEGINILYSLGEVAGQRSEHLFIHVIPRYKDDKVHLVWEPKQLSPEDFKDITEKLSEGIKKFIAPPPKKEEKVIEIPKPPEKVYITNPRTGAW